MTLHAPYAPITYTCNAVTTRFPITFLFANPETVRVVETDADGVETVMIYGEGFSIEGGDSLNGTVVATEAPAEDVTWTISRKTPLLLPYGELAAPPLPSEGMTFIAVGGDGGSFSCAMRSTDAGVTWDDCSPSPAGTLVFRCVDGDGFGNWIITGHDEIWSSDDDGLTWTSRTPPVASRRWDYVGAVDSQTFLIVGATGGPPDYVYKTTDNGANWTDVTPAGQDSFFNPASNGTGTVVIPHGAGSNNVFNAWVSEDYGDTWVEINEANGYSDGRLISFVGGSFVCGLRAPGIVYSTTGLTGSWTLKNYTGLFTNLTGPFTYDGTDWWGSAESSSSAQMKTAALGTTPTQASGPDQISFNGIASDGDGAVVFVDYNDQFDPDYPGVYRTEGSLVLTPVIPPAGQGGADYNWVSARSSP